MTTFTAIRHGESPSIGLDVRNTISAINPNIYGGFVEHMGRCIYGGVYDPESPLSDENGFRKDVMEAIKELQVPVMRYPGGNFTATYHWMDGVGPRDQRPKRPELAWLGIESNSFGTDEFMKWCEMVNTAPYLCFNMGTGTLDEALAWLEYCNSTQDTYYANLRRKNGHEEPYNVKYWALGNEVWGPWQVAQNTKEEYAHKAYQWAKALKMQDPSIELVLCGETGCSSWDQYVLKHCLKKGFGIGGGTTSALIDMHSLHLYTASPENVPNTLSPRAAERGIELASAFIDLARIENGVPASVPRPKICWDEWNTWDPKKFPGEQGAEQIYNHSDALAVSVWLNVFVRQARNMAMANIAQSVNVLSPLLTTRDTLTKQTIFYPLYLYSRYMRGHSLSVHVRCPEHDGSMAAALSADGTNFGWLNGTVDLPLLDVSASVGDAVDDEEDGTWATLAIVNADETKAYAPELDVAGGLEGKRVKVFSVVAGSVKAINTAEKEDVTIRESAWDGKGRFELQRASLTMFRWKV